MRNNRRARGGRSPARGARWRILPVIAAIAAFLCMGVRAAAADSLDSWPSASQSVLGERTQPLEFTINPQNVSHLKPKWVFTTHGNVSATPTVVGGVVYFPDWGGYINAVEAATGKLIWQREMASYDGVSGLLSIAARKMRLMRVWYPLPAFFSQATTSASRRIEMACFTGR